MSVAAARQRYRTLLANGATLADFTEGAPALVDSRFSSDVQGALDRFNDEQLLPYPRLAFAAGRLAALGLQTERATRLFSAAAGAGLADAALVARAFWEIGCLQLREDNVEAAEAALALARAALGDVAAAAADVIHLEALIMERHGEAETARRMYRSAIAAGGSLTPLTRITAMRNLAASLTHVDPHESLGVSGLALALIDADLLDDRARPTILNIQAYALLCTGQVADAIARADQAYDEATRFGHELIARYARFNLAIAHELSDEFGTASAELDELLAATDRIPELTGWIRLRQGWLALKSGDVGFANRILVEVNGEPHGHIYDQACATLRALIAFRSHDMKSAMDLFAELADRYADQGDQLTAFVLLLWFARASSEAGIARTPQATLSRAARLAWKHGFRVSPNWWSADLATFARATADADAAPLLSGLLIAGGHLQPEPEVEVRVGRDGSVTINGQSFAKARWRIGKTGSGVLKKTFSLLVSSHPVGVSRDELIDALWPETDGDRALANLHACLNDLRHFLAQTPGLSLVYDGGTYRLAAATFVHFDATDSAARSAQR